MANEEHITILKQGVEVWNQWRENNTSIEPDLRNADLSLMNLKRIDLMNAQLINANLSQANLEFAILNGADLTQANLSQAEMFISDLFRVSAKDSNFEGAKLIHADMRYAELQNANLRQARLQAAILTGANLNTADLSDARIGSTMFGDNDLSGVRGLDSIYHTGPSTIGIDTIYKSEGNISESFLRGAGLPDNFITYMASLTGKAFEFYSCFISYSSNDQLFAERLYADLQSKGGRSWFAPEDLKIGEEIRIGIDESIRKHDKLLLVLSKASVTSQWVQQEVEIALAKEREQKRTVLFPIRLDNTVMEIKTGWPALIKNTRHIGDFRQWKKHDSYQKNFARLLRDLKAQDMK